MESAKKHVVLAVTLAEPGGVQSFLLAFAEWLRTKGHDVTIVAGDGMWLYAQCRVRGIRTVQLRHLKRNISPLEDLRAIRECARVFAELKPDAIHLNSSKMGAIGALATARIHPKPRTVYRIGGWVFLEPLSAWKRWLYTWIERKTASKKDAIICVHPGDAQAAAQRGITPRESIEVVPNGIDLPTFRSQLLDRETARATLGVPADARVFGTIAHFYPPKDLPRYMEACSIVARAIPTARFVLVGDGMERPAIEAAARTHQVDRQVLFAGARDHASRLLRAFDTFVLPSAKEGMPWSVLEAMAAEIPCVVTDVGANRWMLEDGAAGWIVLPQHPVALANAMQEALNNADARAEKTRRAMQIIQTRFPLERTFQENARILLGRR